MDQTITNSSIHSSTDEGRRTGSVPKAMFVYRPDLDGLRALAILLVIADHYFSSFNLFRGQLGVDIFFVISGYLTTSIVSKEYANGTFSFTSFYARRVKRLFPILIVCFMVALVVGWFVLDASGFRLLGGTVAASVSGVMNLVLALGMDFFPTDSRIMPFAHLWSLAQEEQFYVMMPFVMVASKRNAVFRKIMIPILLILCVLSWQYWYEHKDIFGRTYYHPAARSWELLSGAVLALSWGRIKGIGMAYNTVARTWSGYKIPIFLLRIIGTMLIVLEMGSSVPLLALGALSWIWSWFILKRTDAATSIRQVHSHGLCTDWSVSSAKQFYSAMTVLGWCLILSGLSMPHEVPLCLAAILSTIGMVVLIIGGSALPDQGPVDPGHTHQPVHKGWSYAFLSCPVMTYFGRISYALYVLHYPLYTMWIMSRGHGVMWDNGLKTFMVLACLAVTPVVYRYIEEPTRRAPYVWRWVWAMAVCGVLGYMAACGWMVPA
ncbi:MAG: acyltransferase [Alphaproteobacteria bacterium]|nr:acyltransferase [Alphaproteobacteria bacterium]